jgi:polysaccharide pyruvyl transferase WcaK-like protein
VESDSAAAAKVKNLLPAVLRSRVHLVATDYDQSEIKGVIGLCQFFVGSRMHACIAALSQQIPTIGVAYSKKFRGVFDSIGVGEWVIDGRDLTSEEAVNRCVSLFSERERLRLNLARNVAFAQEQLNQTFQSLLGGETKGRLFQTPDPLARLTH